MAAGPGVAVFAQALSGTAGPSPSLLPVGNRRSSLSAASSTPSEYTDDGTSTFFKKRRKHLRRHGSYGQVLVNSILSSQLFDFAIGLVIVANSLNIAAEQGLRLHHRDTSLVDLLEHVFICIYIVELLMRFYVGGLACLKDTWILFDFVLVISGIITHWVMPSFAASADELGPLMVLRMGRLLRLARTLRLLTKFQVLWMLVRGLMNSVTTMCYTMLLLLLMFFIFGCIAMELIRNNELVVGDHPDADFTEIVMDYFADLPRAMLTLIQFVTFDNIALVYRPLIEQDVSLLFFFVPAVLIIGIVLMNLVTAVIVQGALEQAIQDKDLVSAMEERKRKVMVRQLRVLFRRLDADGSGYLSREEIAAISADDKALLSSLMRANDPLEVFDALDLDKTGDIGIDDFVEGIRQVAVSNTPIHMKRMEKQIDLLYAGLRGVQKMQLGMQESIRDILIELRQHRNGSQQLRPPGAALGTGSMESSDSFLPTQRPISPHLPTAHRWSQSSAQILGSTDMQKVMTEVCSGYFDRGGRRAPVQDSTSSGGIGGDTSGPAAAIGVDRREPPLVQDVQSLSVGEAMVSQQDAASRLSVAASASSQSSVVAPVPAVQHHGKILKDVDVLVLEEDDDVDGCAPKEWVQEETSQSGKAPSNATTLTSTPVSAEGSSSVLKQLPGFLGLRPARLRTIQSFGRN